MRIAVAVVSLAGLSPPAADAQIAAPALNSGAKTAKPAVEAGSAKGSGAPIEQIAPDVAVQKATAYLNSATSFVADFVQIGADGRRAEGKLYVQRPGRLRFEYAQPATLEIIADGTSVSIRDRKLATQDLYFISQTPLKFLLKDKIDLRKDVKILDVGTDRKGAVITVEDKATFGGTSRIKLIFDPKSFALKQWQVTDPQGYETLVSLFNVDLGQTPDSSLFKINNERMLNPN
jgi:outer membrane lipoprotein-sorting protein